MAGSVVHEVRAASGGLNKRHSQPASPARSAQPGEVDRDAGSECWPNEVPAIPAAVPRRGISKQRSGSYWNDRTIPSLGSAPGGKNAALTR